VGDSLNVAGKTVPHALDPASGAVSLRVFFDRSVLEVFVNRGAECVTRVVASALPVRAELFASGGSVEVRRLDAWRMRSIW
jgi:sucrose-6-phosphate hydrolase SacC (GH32 family)